MIRKIHRCSYSGHKSPTWYINRVGVASKGRVLQCSFYTVAFVLINQITHDTLSGRIIFCRFITRRAEIYHYTPQPQKSHILIHSKAPFSASQNAKAGDCCCRNWSLRMRRVFIAWGNWDDFLHQLRWNTLWLWLYLVT